MLSCLKGTAWMRWYWQAEAHCSFSWLLHSYQPTSQNLPRRWNRIFLFGSFWVLLLESFWQIQGYLSTTLSSIFRHGCSSCCGEFLSGDNISINYLQGFLFLFSFVSKTLLSTPHILERWKEMQGCLRVFDALFPSFHPYKRNKSDRKCTETLVISIWKKWSIRTDDQSNVK